MKKQEKTIAVDGQFSAAKKLLSILLAFVMLLGITAGVDLSVYAEISGDYQYAILEDGTIEITGYNGSASNLSIPSTIDGKKVTSIGNWAFYNCSKLTSIFLPNCLNNIFDSAFNKCTSLENISVAEDNENYASQNGVLYSKDKSKLIRYPQDKTNSSFTIPSSVTSIEQNAFENCKSFESITIPENVKRIRQRAFNFCTNLKEIIVLSNDVDIESFSLGYDIEGFDEWDREYHQCEYKISGYKNSTVEQYANEHFIEFVVICETHTYDNGKVTKAATCTATGTKKYTCTTCGATKTETIKATGHKAVTDKAVTATCTKAGKTAGSHCSVCNAVITAQKTAAATGHSYDKGKVTKAATCTATGTKTYTCTKCKATKKETIKATGHSYKTTVTKATTKKNGGSVTKCTKCGNVSKKTTIYYPKTVTLSTTSYTYDGKVKKPGVTVKDSKGKKIAASNYTVTYPSGRKNVGTYTVKITFKGNYSGSVSKTFKINPKNTSISSLSAQSKAFTVKLKKYTTQTTGYQIQYSTSSNFSNAKTVTVKNTTTSKKISKLSGKKKYYVRIRTYKTVGKTNYYSGWTKAKTVTTKK